MPASEQIWYPIKRLHRIFAWSSLALLAATIWMFVQDHRREWKPIQRTARQIDRRFEEWRQLDLVTQGSDPGDERQLRQLEASIAAKRSTFFDPQRGFPFPGKRLLELPVFDAFNSPLKIDNRWSEGLTQDFHFAQVNRFDRCVTCHTAIAQVDPENPTRALHATPRTVDLILDVPRGAASSADDAQPGVSEVHQAVGQLGIRLADAGLLRQDDPTVMFVRDGSPAAAARVSEPPDVPRSADEIRAWLMGPPGDWAAAVPPIGIRPGDVLLAVNGREVAGREDAMVALAEGVWDDSDSAEAGQASEAVDDRVRVQVTVRRGLPHPYAGHPRLDLYVGDLSPHRLADFACTICHGGEGSATEFRWTSHTPNDPEQRAWWRNEYDWFKNPHWAYPMLPQRFLQSSCLRCHHQVDALMPSQRFSEPPAPKLLRGYRLIQHWGCFGCHEINGFDAERSLGPDVRLEPHPSANNKEAPHPGRYRRPGPSLRTVGHRLDASFLLEWLRDPRGFRPSTRMPRVFGLWDHLTPDQRQAAEENESAEIQGIVAYLESYTEPLPETPAGMIGDADDTEQRISLGREVFLTRGCLACHEHPDFPDAAGYRESDTLLLGPELSNLSAKYRDPAGQAWLQRFLRQPSVYLPRTPMPDLRLEPIEERDADGVVVRVIDPVADLVAFLFSDSDSEPLVLAPESPDSTTVDRLVAEYLAQDFPRERAREYTEWGIPSAMRSVVREAEQEWLVADDDSGGKVRLAAERKLSYLGQKSIAKYGCYGCHDIPGFEYTKPIGIDLSDWGRKDPGQLGFAKIAEYLSAPESDVTVHGGEEGFYRRLITEGDRIGFLHQKLRQPRSFDYRVVQDKGYHERLRMPRFPLSEEDREAIMTFILGLVAQPPGERFLPHPDARREAIIQGQAVLDAYRCGSCHVMQPEEWRLAFPPDSFRPQRIQPTFPAALHEFAEDALATSKSEDARGLRQAAVRGMPTLDDKAQPMVFDDYGDELFDDEDYDRRSLEYAFQLWEPAILDGQGYQVGESPLAILGSMVQQRRAAEGGFLTRYLLPRVTQHELRVNPNAKGAQAWGWLPPPLIGQGAKVQPGWLHDYLLDPYPIRPASRMRMPRFDLSDREATALANYFAARDAVDYPYDFVEERSPDYLQSVESRFPDSAAESKGSLPGAPDSHFAEGMRILTDKNYCVTCHIIADFDPQTSDRAKGPDLSDVYRRFRPAYLRRWIAKPVSVLPYTGMPINIPYDPEDANLGGVSQSLYAGSSVEQLDALVDLLMNFDRYARQRSGIAPLTESAPWRSLLTGTKRRRKVRPEQRQ